MAQQIINVGSAPNDGTGEVLRNSQIKANANFTELYTNKAESSEVLSNDETTYTDATLPLTGTEVALLNDGTNWVKITWTNIKAQLKTYFDTVYQAILVSGTNIKTINGTSILGSGDLVVGAKSEQILNFFGYPNLTPINNWHSAFTLSNSYNNLIVYNTYGNGTTPDYTLSWNAYSTMILPNSKLISARLLIDFSSTNNNSELEIYVGTGQKGTGSPYPGGDINYQGLVLHTVSLPTGGSNLRYLVNLTVLTHSTLAENKIYIAYRTKINTNQYKLQLELKFKEQ